MLSRRVYAKRCINLSFEENKTIDNLHKGNTMKIPTQTKLDRRNFLKLAGSALSAAALAACASPISALAKQNTKKPNFIIIFCDDLGYGDIGCFGSEKHRTPNIDKMAEQGLKLTSFYVTSGVCTPSRSSLMTGCYPRRTNMHQDAAGLCVLFPVAEKGLNPNEITIAEILKTQNYKTACIGKWHLGDQKKFLPTKQGFDFYFGIPYSNDMGSRQHTKNPPLPLLKNETVIEAPVNQNTLTKRYTEQAVKFITENKDNPFFLYLPHTMPHNPVHAGDRFRDKSANGRYGDAVEEIDYSTGHILKTLEQLNIDKNTLVIFTSDNGAAKRYGGSNLPLAGFKGSTLEGGMREPCVVRWPANIPAGTSCDELTSTIDLLPTFALLAGAATPKNTIIDGKDIRPILFGKPNAKSLHEAFYYYQVDQLQAVRSGKWKLHLPLETKKRNWGKPEMNYPLKLYDLKADIAEKYNIADKHPDVVKKLLALAKKAQQDLGDINKKGQNQRPAAFVQNPVPLTIKKR